MGDSHRDFAINQGDAELQPDGSYINKYGVITWYNDAGSVHKEDGPAIIMDERIRWFFNGTSYSFNEWLKLTPISDEIKMLLKLQYA
jgi:hypothetical protein